MAYRRTSIGTFALANRAYTNADVAFYQIDPITQARLVTLAPLYDSPTANTTQPNPITLDGDGKFAVPIYVDEPVIGIVSGSEVGGHETGILYPLQRSFRGTWTAATTYYTDDLVREPGGAYDIYACNITHTSGVWNTDKPLKWVLYAPLGEAASTATAAAGAASTSASNAAGSATAAAGSATAAANSATAAANSATSIANGPVTSVNTKTGVVTLNATDVGVVAGTTAVAGIVQLSTATNSTSTTLAATASAVKTAWDLANGKIGATAPVLTDYRITAVNLAAGVAISTANGNYFYKTVTGTTTFTFATGATTGTQASGFILELTNGGAFTVTWPASVKWPSGVAPALTAAGVDILAFITDDAGTTWRGILSQRDSK
jgi:hypothetical protein